MVATEPESTRMPAPLMKRLEEHELALAADEVSAELQQVVQQQLRSLSQETQQQARVALQSSVLDLIAQQSAREDVSELAKREYAQVNPVAVAE